MLGKAEVDLKAYIEFLTSTTFTAPVYRVMGNKIVESDFDKGGFAAKLGQKDNRLLLNAAEDLGVPLPLANLLRDRFLTLSANGDFDRVDWTAIARLCAADAGLT